MRSFWKKASDKQLDLLGADVSAQVGRVSLAEGSGAMTAFAAHVRASGQPLMVPVSALEEDTANPRTEFPDATLDDLAAGIHERGILQPIIVEPLGEGSAVRYRVRLGARRLRAAIRAGLIEVPVTIVSGPLDAYAQVAENLKRDGLSPLDLARFIRSRVDAGESNATIAKKLGLDQAGFIVMHEAFEDEGEGEERLAGLAAGAVASLGQDWDVVTAMLPAQWQAKAVELGAVRRLRGFSSVEALLRVLLIHLADGCSLRETAVRARAGDLADVSDVALLKRLRGCGPWFQWMAHELAAQMSVPAAPAALLAGKRVRLVDGSSVCEPGATGSTWRLHYALNLQTLSCDEVHVSQASEGESLTRFTIRPGDVIMADRGFAKRPGLRHVVQHKADVVLRTSLTNLPLQDRRGRPLALLALLRSLAIGQAADWPAGVSDNKGVIAVRVCAYKKTAAQTLAAQEAIRQEARRKRREVKPETLEAAGYVIVLTTLMQPSAQAIMELYRRRWQVELAFKRLKSLLQLGHLKKIDKDGARAWLQGKLLVACLIETLILTAERFSPWGYPRDERSIAASALALA